MIMMGVRRSLILWSSKARRSCNWGARSGAAALRWAAAPVILSESGSGPEESSRGSRTSSCLVVVGSVRKLIGLA